jgi:predicted dehydrogenase
MNAQFDWARAAKVTVSAGTAVETSYDAVLRRDDIDLIDILSAAVPPCYRD